MPVTTLSSREFNQDRSRAGKAAKKGPVIITNRGREELVLLNIHEYNHLAGRGKSILELLRMPEGTPAFDDFEFPRSQFEAKPVDFD